MHSASAGLHFWLYGSSFMFFVTWFERLHRIPGTPKIGFHSFKPFLALCMSQCTHI